MRIQYHSEWSDSLRQEGQISGARGKILRALEIRGISLTETQRRAVEACEDLTVLDLWFDNAFKASSTDDVFAETE
ncbi:hypothetical protein [Salininema proteolyticum]|uniref:DUF4351 domain-containing protein n=1 Tax=Salininema proteolyticum TaxID=1607685 RepID=A0ABV8TSF5_9ACTN